MISQSMLKIISKYGRDEICPGFSWKTWRSCSHCLYRARRQLWWKMHETLTSFSTAYTQLKGRDHYETSVYMRENYQNRSWTNWVGVWGISWPAEQLVANQGHCSMELISRYFQNTNIFCEHFSLQFESS